MKRTDLLLAGGFAATTLVAVFLAGAQPRGEQVVVFGSPFAPPGTTANIVAAAHGELVGATRLHWAVIARSGQPEFLDALYHNGALFVADAGLAATCLGRAARADT